MVATTEFEAPARRVSLSIQSVLDHIEEHFARPLAMAELASLCGLSVTRFVTVFRQQVGTPPHQYVCRTRVRHARHLLRQGVPQAAVAQDTGFCDQSHLARHFKRHYGMTPGLYAGRRQAPAFTSTDGSQAACA